jgi:aldose 1-epimerase
MFKTEKLPFGSSEKIVLSHSSGLSADILPNYGAALNAFYIKTRNGNLINIIDGYNSDIEPSQTGAYYKGVFLFPFPNRLKDGLWNYNGQTLQFPINEKARNNALHGCLFDAKFEIVETSASVEMASVLLRYKPSAILEYYPFDYQIDIEYILTEAEGLAVKTTVQNMNKVDMPFGLGWHPYFRTGSIVNELIFQMANVKSLEVDSQMIPNGIDLNFRLFDHPQTIGETSLDTGFELLDIEFYKIHILDSTNKLKFSVWQESGGDGFGYLQVYTPPHRQSIAIEPMTSKANALQDQSQGLQILEPGNAQSYIWGISF